MTDQLPAILAEFADLEARLADPSAHANPSTARSLGRRYAEITPIVELSRELDALRGDLTTARELAKEDASFGAEVDSLTTRIGQAEARLRELLAPRDPNDGKDVIIEIKAGEGGAESALFAADLMRMYQRYAERAGFSTEILSAMESELGGVRGASLAVKAGRNSTAGPWRRLKYEGGVHRVQRVPVTESAGRIHTSAAGVLVMPEAEEVDLTIDPGDLKIDVYRSSGPGGQSVNTTDSAVRITHLPTGTVVSMQNEKSQIQNRAAAMRVLRARLLALAESERAAERSAARRSQVRTVDRSERVRTYNFPENRISDHRVGYKSHNLDQVLDGDLDAVIDALIAAETALAAGDSARAENGGGQQ